MSTALQTGRDDRVRAIVAKTADLLVEQVTDDRTFSDDLNIDSLERVEMVMAIEAEFGIHITDDEIEDLRSVGDLIKLLNTATGAAHV